jgi:hypothetical protein
MGKGSSRKSGGDRKHGRSARKPAHLRYNMERRWEINKARKKAKLAKKLAKRKAKNN